MAAIPTRARIALKDSWDGSDRGNHHSHGSGGPADRMSKRW